MNLEGIVVGAIVAIISGTLIPFLTTQFSLWSQQRRDLTRARRKALHAVVKAQAIVHVNTARKFEALKAAARGGHAGPDEIDYALIRARRIELMAHFTTADRAFLDMLDSERPSDPYATPMLSSESEMVLATWAAGRNVRAHRAARRLIKERAEKSERAPESNDGN